MHLSRCTSKTFPAIQASFLAKVWEDILDQLITLTPDQRIKLAIFSTDQLDLFSKDKLDRFSPDQFAQLRRVIALSSSQSAEVHSLSSEKITELADRSINKLTDSALSLLIEGLCPVSFFEKYAVSIRMETHLGSKKVTEIFDKCIESDPFFKMMHEAFKKNSK